MDLESLFSEPQDFRPEPQPTAEEFQRANGEILHLDLVAAHSLWAHVLWNAARSMAKYIDCSLDLRSCNVLEMGAAAALPSIICARKGATVVSSDYPDARLVDNIQFNAENNLDIQQLSRFSSIGFCWGQDCKGLLDLVDG